MNNKKIYQAFFLFTFVIIFLFSNYKNNTIQKFRLGTNEITLHKIRTDQNVFSGLIFYPRGVEKLRVENDHLNLNDFNENLKSIISDKNLYENAVSELIFELGKKYELYKVDRRPSFTKIFLSGRPSEIKNDINLITGNYKNFLFRLLENKIVNFENYLEINEISFYQFSVRDIKNKNLIFLTFTILLMILALLSFFEISKVIKKKKFETN